MCSSRSGLKLEHRRVVRSLGAADRLLLGAALGLITRPPVLVLDELDEDTTPEETAAVLDALRALTASGVTVVAGTLDPGLTPAADVALALDADGSPAAPDLPAGDLHRAGPAPPTPSSSLQEVTDALV